MGAISFTLDANLLHELKRLLPLTLFVETGTFRGESLAQAEPLFERCISIEISPEHYQAAQARFGALPNVRLILGDSAKALAQVAPDFQRQSTLFWLDAHWCATDGGAIGTVSQCPLLEELHSIGNLRPDSVVLIDDARYFLSPPPASHDIVSWPDLDQVLKALQQMSSAHILVCYNDILAFVPRDIYPTFRSFMHQNVTDVLTLADKAREYNQVLLQLQDKEILIKALQNTAEHRQDVIVKMEAVIQDLKRTCDERYDLIHRLTYIGQHRFKKVTLALTATGRARVSRLRRQIDARAKAWLEKRTPFRLGHFSQYPPRPLQPEKFPHRAAPRQWPRICLVTPSYQQAPFLERTMRSVLEQDYPNLAYGVQDGGSTDGSVEIIMRHIARLAHTESAPDQGQADAIRKGFAKLYPLRNDVMGWLNSDDTLMPGALAYVGAYFERHPQVDVIYGHRVVIDEQDREIGRWYLPPYHKQTLKWFDLVPQETLFWRASCFEDIGGMDASFQFAMDWDLLLRFERAGFKIRRVPYFLGCFRTHTQQKTSAKIQTIGEKEMDQLRLRTHGRNVQRWEIHEHLTAEETSSARVAWLHQLGLRA